MIKFGQVSAGATLPGTLSVDSLDHSVILVRMSLLAYLEALGFIVLA